MVFNLLGKVGLAYIKNKFLSKPPFLIQSSKGIRKIALPYFYKSKYFWFSILFPSMWIQAVLQISPNQLEVKQFNIKIKTITYIQGRFGQQH